MTLNNQQIAKGAIIGGLINGIINGIINWFEVRGESEILITVDSISHTGHSVMGGAVTMGSSIAIILTLIGYFTLKSADKPPFFPNALLLTLKNGFSVFGVLITLGVLFQRYFGSLTVKPFVSVVIVVLIAGGVATIIDYSTKRELLKQ